MNNLITLDVANIPDDFTNSGSSLIGVTTKALEALAALEIPYDFDGSTTTNRIRYRNFKNLNCSVSRENISFLDCAKKVITYAISQNLTLSSNANDSKGVDVRSDDAFFTLNIALGSKLESLSEYIDDIRTSCLQLLHSVSNSWAQDADQSCFVRKIEGGNIIDRHVKTIMTTAGRMVGAYRQRNIAGGGTLHMSLVNNAIQERNNSDANQPWDDMKITMPVLEVNRGENGEKVIRQVPISEPLKQKEYYLLISPSFQDSLPFYVQNPVKATDDLVEVIQLWNDQSSRS